MLNFVGADGCIFVYIGDEMFSIKREHPQYAEINELLDRDTQEDDEKARELITRRQNKPLDPAEQIPIVGDTVKYRGRTFDEPVMADIIRRLENVDNKAVRKFVGRCCANPNPGSIRALLAFLKHKNLPLTENGRFLAYKAARPDYYDIYSRTYLNRPGITLRIPRSDVEYNDQLACSYGFHVGTYEYASSYGTSSCGDSARIVLVEADPYHVVSVPRDGEQQKLRLCQYTVLCDFEEILSHNDVYDAEGKAMSFTRYLADVRNKEESSGFCFKQARCK